MLSLRLRLIGLVALVLVASLAAGGTIACRNAAHSVETEMRSALAVAQQNLEAGVATLGESSDLRRDLERLVASFRGNRHLRVTLTGAATSTTVPPVETAPLGDVPRWFVRLIGVEPMMTRLPVSFGGESQGSITIETVPHNEIAETWQEFADGLLVLLLFSVPTMLLIYLFIGRALRPLDRFAAALGAIGRGDNTVRLTEALPPELARLRDSFNRTATRLAEMAAENRRLNEELLGLQERERGELARDLHDEVGPFLFAINIDAAAIERHAASGRVAPIASHVHSIVEAVAHMQRQVKSMLGRLKPLGLAEFGLKGAIDGLVDFWRRRRPDIAYHADIAPEAATYGELVDLTVYRIVQECLSNIARHSRSSRVEISIAPDASSRDVPAALVVTIADNGRGMDGPASAGYGLLGMGERVKALGGLLTITNKPDEGFTVTARLPYPSSNPSAAHSAV